MTYLCPVATDHAASKRRRRAYRAWYITLAIRKAVEKGLEEDRGDLEERGYGK
jgi:hypothetical protein